MAKRKDYFKKFGIITVTFADDRLTDIEDCFCEIRSSLSERPLKAVSEGAELAKIAALI